MGYSIDPMNNRVLTLDYIKEQIAPVAKKYGVDEIYVFGSYARGEATSDSDVDLLVFGGSNFKPANIFALAEEIRHVLDKDVDMFEINEINVGSEFYDRVMEERVLVA